MMQVHSNVPAGGDSCEAPGSEVEMPRRARPRPSFDPIEIAYRAGQAGWRDGLVDFINTQRRGRRLPPVERPTVAPTPSVVRWRHGPTKLLQYTRPSNDAGASIPAHGAPLLIVCSLINRPYILDLIEGRSVVRRLLDAGRDVWLVDWGDPEPADAARTLGHYALDRLGEAASVVLDRTGAPSLHVLGYCMGGTFALAAIATGALPAASLIALATPVDFKEGGLLAAWCRAPGFDPAELARTFGNIPPHVTGPAFKMLDPAGLVTKGVHLSRKIGDDDFVRFFLAMETWLEDSVSFPGRAFVDWVDLYRYNALAAGTLKLDGKHAFLARITCPILNIVAEADYITPPASSLALTGLVQSHVYEPVTMAGGHIGLSTGGAAHRELWPRVARWLREHEPVMHPHNKKPRRMTRAQHKRTAEA